MLEFLFATNVEGFPACDGTLPWHLHWHRPETRTRNSRLAPSVLRVRRRGLFPPRQLTFPGTSKELPQLRAVNTDRGPVNVREAKVSLRSGSPDDQRRADAQYLNDTHMHFSCVPSAICPRAKISLTSDSCEETTGNVSEPDARCVWVGWTLWWLSLRPVCALWIFQRQLDFFFL